MKNLNKRARGSALIYILIAIALIAALTATFMQPASQETHTQNSYKLVAELNSQVQMIRSSIQDCILQYPKGDWHIPGNIGYHASYPMDPDSSYLPTSPSIRAADKLVANIRCPGNNPGNPDPTVADPTTNQHVPIFGGSTGRFMPSTLALFNPWTYRNGTSMSIDGQTVTGVFFQITSTATDSYIAEAMQKVDEQFAACEADYIAGNGSNGCANNTKCLRIWVKRVAPTCP